MYGLIGKPLGHSFSAKYFNEKFANEGIPEHYNLFPLDSIEEIKELIETNRNLKGLNVTIPYKEAVFPYLNEISNEAREIGAVNVIKISRDEKGNLKLSGHNSDVSGFRKSLKPYLRPDIKKALILGSGGASKAVKYILDKEGIESLTVSRAGGKDRISYCEITPHLMEDSRLIVNATPVGMYPHIDEAPDIPYDLLTPRHICFDLIYNPEETLFMKKAKARGATTVNGMEMLHLQAEGAWKIWNS